MNVVLKIFSYPFTWGLLVGLLVAAWMLSLWVGAKRKASSDIEKKNEEISKLTNANNTSTVTLSGQIEELNGTLEEKQKEITNLRLELTGLQQKPGRAELKKLDTYEKAVAILQEDVPGFAQCWPKALRAAEGNREARAELKRIFSPAPAATVLPAAETSAQTHAALPPAT